MAAVKALKVLSPGPLTTVQDIGRLGYGKYGVAPSGALDNFSLRVANILVGNFENEACLEITLFGLKVRVLTDVVIAVTGADIQLLCNDKPLNMWESYLLKKEDVLTFARIKSGCRSYLAIGGGISLPKIMKSKSTNLSSIFGGFEGRALQKKDIILSNYPHTHLKNKGRRFKKEWIYAYSNNWNLRVILGPQDDQFTNNGKTTFLNTPYQVTPFLDRTGIRLSGQVVEKKRDVPESIISEAVISGAIQVPGDGQPIIILTETVTGGYRKIATVISADLHLLGQIKSGDTISFSQVFLDDAHNALRDMERIIKKIKKDFR